MNGKVVDDLARQSRVTSGGSIKRAFGWLQTGYSNFGKQTEKGKKIKPMAIA